MRIVEIAIENWMPFGGFYKLTIPAGPIAVVARYEENPDRSNWAGKTAFLEAIEWALFGVHRKRYEDGLIHNGDNTINGDETAVGILFDNGDKIERRRKRGKATQIWACIDGIEYRKKDAQRAIEELIGFDGSDYRATLCFAQGDTEAIVDRAPGERRKMIGEWLELDAWFRVAARARVQMRDAVQELKGYQRRYDEAHAWLEGQDLKALKQAEAEAAAVVKQARAKRDAAQARVDDANRSLAAIDARERLEAVKEERAALKRQLTGATVEGEDEARAKYDEANAAAQAAQTELTEARDLVSGYFDGQCPVMREACPVADTVANNREAAGVRHRAAQTEARERGQELIAARRLLQQVETERRRIGEMRARFNSLTERARELAEQAQGAENALSRAEIDRLRQAVTMAQDAVDRAVRFHSEAEQAIVAYERVAEDEAAAGERIAEARDTVRIAALALKAVGPTGIPQWIAAQALEQLEEKANGLIAGVGLSISFEMDRQTRDLEPVCSECGYTYRGQRDKACPACEATRAHKRADELEILIDDGSGEVEDAKAKSGGAKALIASAIRLAASLMVRELRGSPCAWAQVDEPFGSLDTENRATLARTFAGMLGAVGLEQAFVVSHDAALLDSLPSRIEITRKGNRSALEVIA